MVERKNLKARRVFVADSKGSIQQADVSSRDTIWPEIYFFEYPKYSDSLNGKKAWGVTAEEALAKIPLVPKNSQIPFPMRSLTDHFGSPEVALDTFPIVYDEASTARLAQSLAESFAFAACMAPEDATFAQVVERERILPATIYRYVGGLDILYGQIKTLMSTVKILANAGQTDTLETVIPTLTSSCTELARKFVNDNAKKLGLVSHLTMDEESRASAAKILEHLHFEK